MSPCEIYAKQTQKERLLSQIEQLIKLYAEIYSEDLTFHKKITILEEA